MIGIKNEHEATHLCAILSFGANIFTHFLDIAILVLGYFS